MTATVRPWLPALAAVAACFAGCATATGPLDAALAGQPVVLLGEVHDNPQVHAQRADALRRALAAGRRPALLMEQFDRERQPDIDRVLAQPSATADDLVALGATGWDWPLYRPVLALAIEYRLPVIAVNVSRADARQVIANGLAAQGYDAQVPPDVLDAQSAAIVEGHCGQIDDVQARRLAQAQVARDQTMARAIEAQHGRPVVLLAGNGHVRRDIGVPRWLDADTRAHTRVVGFTEPGGADDPNAFDVHIATPAPERADPCATFDTAPPPAR